MHCARWCWSRCIECEVLSACLTRPYNLGTDASLVHVRCRILNSETWLVQDEAKVWMRGKLLARHVGDLDAQILHGGIETNVSASTSLGTPHAQYVAGIASHAHRRRAED